MAIDVSYRDTYTTSAEDLSRTNKNFIVNEGVAFDGLKVTQSGTPAMTVAVATGTGYFYGSGTNSNVMYEFYSDANETVTIGASGVSARIDIICLKVDASTGVASIVAVAGTPSGSPAVPATPASHYKLAEVAVGAGVTSITNANITDTRRSVFIMPTGARNQGLINGYIRATVASNNLTLAISTSPTSLVAPSTTNPVGIWIGNTLRWITSALSVTVNAGTNWLNMGSAELATKEVDLFPYLQWNTTTQSINLLASRIPYARIMGDFVNSGTNEKGVFGIVNYNSGDNVVNVGRFAATLSAGAGFTWSVPSFTNANLIQEPIYETRRLDYVPSFPQDGSMTFTSVTINHAYYVLRGRNLFFVISARGTTGGGQSISITPTLPFQLGFSNESPATATVRDASSGAQSVGWGVIDQSSNRLYIRKFDTSNYTLGTDRDVRATGTYII